MNLLVFVSAFTMMQGAGLIPDQFLPKPPPNDKVVAKVNNAEIKVSDVEAFLWDWRAQEVLQDLISYQLIRSEAEKVKITLPEIEVLKAVDDQLSSIKKNLPPDKDLDSALRDQGFPRSRLYLRVRTEMMLQRIAEKEFDPAKFVRVSTMVFKPKSVAAADVSEAVTKAQAAYDKLAKGEKWETVLKSTQDNPGLLNSNGLLGWRTIEAFPEPTRVEMRTGRAGTLTKPVQTSAGIQFFRLEVSGASLKGEGLDELKELYMNTAQTEILERLRREGKVERFMSATGS